MTPWITWNEAFAPWEKLPPQLPHIMLHARRGCYAHKAVSRTVVRAVFAMWTHCGPVSKGNLETMFHTNVGDVSADVKKVC